MKADHARHLTQRQADRLREAHDLSYEEVIRYAVQEKITYVAAVRELAEKKERRGGR